MIAHRLSAIQDADLILVFKDGRIIKRGTQGELLAGNGVYAAMWKDYQTSISWNKNIVGWKGYCIVGFYHADEKFFDCLSGCGAI